MPTGKEGHRFFERLIKLEERVNQLMTFHKWQMALLAAIFLAALKAAIH
jgi:hypothetical protein